MTKGQESMKKGKCKNNDTSSMSKLAGCDLKSKCDTLKVHDICRRNVCKTAKQNVFSPSEIQLEEAGYKNTMKNFLKGNQKT